MPIREHKCKDCGFQFESIDLRCECGHKPEDSSCPNCGSRDVEKKISLFSSPNSESSSRDTRPQPRRFG